MTRTILAALITFVPLPVGAVEHPACTDRGLDNGLCELMALVVNIENKPCYRVMDVLALGDGVYRTTCERTSHDRAPVVYTIECTDGVGCFLR